MARGQLVAGTMARALGGAMSILPSILGAMAATIAAVFSGLTLYVSGRREHRRWMRDSLVDTYVKFLGASFEGTAQGKAENVRLQADNAEVINDYRTQIAGIHDLQTAMLIKLRMIAPSSVVKAAENLHEADHVVTQAALESVDVAGDSWGTLRSQQRAARTIFVDQGIRSLGLGQGAPIAHSHGQP